MAKGAPFVNEGTLPVEAVAHAAQGEGGFDDDDAIGGGRRGRRLPASASGEPADGFVENPGLLRFPAVDHHDAGGAHFEGGPDVEGIEESAVGEGEGANLGLAKKKGNGAGGGQVLPGDFVVAKKVGPEARVRVGHDADGALRREVLVQGLDASFEGVGVQHAVTQGSGKLPADGIAEGSVIPEGHELGRGGSPGNRPGVQTADGGADDDIRFDEFLQHFPGTHLIGPEHSTG